MSATQIRRAPLNKKAAAEYMGVTERFMTRLVAERRITFIKVGRFVRFSQSTLDEYLERNTIEAVR